MNDKSIKSDNVGNINQNTMSGGNTMREERKVIPTILAAENNTNVAEEYLQQKTIKTVTKDSQSKKYQLTINNPNEKGYTHEHITEILETNFKTLLYHCMADEKSSTGTLHTHLLACFSSRVRLSMIMNYLPEAHVEICRGTISENIDYIKKSGRYATNEKKQEQVIEGTFEEHGTRPPDTLGGRRRDMADLMDMIEAGMSNAEIIRTNPDLILHIDKINKARTDILIDKYQNTIRFDMKVIYVSGPTGVGKSRYLFETHGADLYRVTDYEHPFDHYNMQPVIAFEEYDSSINIRLFLNLIDIYPVDLPARYNNRYACYETVYIVSNVSLENQYKKIQQNDPETWKAFLRRIKKVIIYNEIGEKFEYNSADEYLRRDDDDSEVY